MSGLNPLVLSAKMGVWMDKNNTEMWPTLEQLGLGVKSDNQQAFDFSDRIFKSNLFVFLVLPKSLIVSLVYNLYTSL